MFGLMAFPALFFSMHSRQFEPGHGMREFVLVEPDDLKILAVMVAVTGEAGFPADFRGGMKSLVLGYA